MALCIFIFAVPSFNFCFPLDKNLDPIMNYNDIIIQIYIFFINVTLFHFLNILNVFLIGHVLLYILKCIYLYIHNRIFDFSFHLIHLYVVHNNLPIDLLLYRDYFVSIFYNLHLILLYFPHNVLSVSVLEWNDLMRL